MNNTIPYLSFDTMPTAGALMGTTGAAEVIANINKRMGSVGFSSITDPFTQGRNMFMQRIITPIREMSNKIKFEMGNLFNEAPKYIAIDSLKALKKGIPATMFEPIIYYPPVRQLLEEGRIDGFGIDPDKMDDDDMFGRLINNGTIVITKDDDDTMFTRIDEKFVNYEMTWDIRSTDLEISDEDLECIEKTRNYFDLFMRDGNTNEFDFTDYPSKLG